MVLFFVIWCFVAMMSQVAGCMFIVSPLTIHPVRTAFSGVAPHRRQLFSDLLISDLVFCFVLGAYFRVVSRGGRKGVAIAKKNTLHRYFILYLDLVLLFAEFDFGIYLVL